MKFDTKCLAWIKTPLVYVISFLVHVIVLDVSAVASRAQNKRRVIFENCCGIANYQRQTLLVQQNCTCALYIFNGS